MMVCVSVGVAICATAAIYAEDLAAAVKERRNLMKKTVAPAAKLGGQMVKGVEPFDAAKAAKAMNDINAVPDKYVTLFPKGTEHGAIADSEALPKIWEDFDNFKALAHEAQGRECQGRRRRGARKGYLHRRVQRHDQSVQGVSRELSRETATVKRKAWSPK